MNTEVQAAQENFPAPKLEANLVDYVTGRLSENGHPDPAAWAHWGEGVHPDAYSTTDFGLHRFFVNRQLRQLIGKVPENTTQIRFCLVEQGTPDDWMRLFEQMVLPCMMKHSIPQREYPSTVTN
jgi:hypothetical protein